MSIPLDRLYNHLDGLCNHDVLIYRFFPHGSKKLEDLVPLSLESWFSNMTKPIIVCHDQEPLQYSLYGPNEVKFAIKDRGYQDALYEVASNMHLRGAATCALNGYDLTLISHSEKNSKELKIYENNGFVGVYWWAHAAIARDWFRYAMHDPVLKYQPDVIQHDFLIYNRAWSGSREYRLKFASLLIEQNLISSCNVKFSPVDNNVHYTQHRFVNSALKPQIDNIENFIPANLTAPCASADYDNVDYSTSAIEVVLETLFDDTRQHLTEKTLRPIACGRPFLLAATPGSLQYLKDYGFETFAPYINEDYDNIQDPVARLSAIVSEMNRISALSQDAKVELWNNLYSIALRNKEKFFSKEWHQSIWDEYITNLNTALDIMNANRSGRYWKETNNDTATKLVGVRFANGPEEIQQFLQWLTEVNS